MMETQSVAAQSSSKFDLCMADPTVEATELLAAASKLMAAARQAQQAAEISRLEALQAGKSSPDRCAAQGHSKITRPMPKKYQRIARMHPTLMTIVEEVADEASCETVDESPVRMDNTTVVIAHIPKDYTQDMLVDLLDLEGFAGRYEFAYLPSDLQQAPGWNYAIVKLVTAEDAESARMHFEDFDEWSIE